MSHDTQAGILGDPAAILRAAGEAFVKLDPRRMILSPVMFTIEVGAVLITILAVARAAGQPSAEHPAFIAAVAVGLWATVVFANFAEAMAEGRAESSALPRQDQHTGGDHEDAGPFTGGRPLMEE